MISDQIAPKGTGQLTQMLIMRMIYILTIYMAASGLMMLGIRNSELFILRWRGAGIMRENGRRIEPKRCRGGSLGLFNPVLQVAQTRVGVYEPGAERTVVVIAPLELIDMIRVEDRSLFIPRGREYSRWHIGVDDIVSQEDDQVD